MLPSCCVSAHTPCLSALHAHAHNRSTVRFLITTTLSTLLRSPGPLRCMWCNSVFTVVDRCDGIFFLKQPRSSCSATIMRARSKEKEQSELRPGRIRSSTARKPWAMIPLSGAHPAVWGSCLGLFGLPCFFGNSQKASHVTLRRCNTCQLHPRSANY